MKTTVTCLQCGKRFQHNRRGPRKFCSLSCYHIATRGRTFSASGGGCLTPGGYWQLSINGRKILAHRHIMEQHLGRQLVTGETVHHINEDKLDNRLKNLVLISSNAAHIVAHATYRTDTDKQCTRCRKVKPRAEFTRNPCPNVDPHRPRCKQCEAEWQKAYRHQRSDH